MSLVPAKPVLDSFVFQAIYGGGYTYLDRCGQTLVDIERTRPDWVPGDVNVTAGNIANEKLRMGMQFTVDRFTVTTLHPTNLDAVGVETQALWNIVRENLGLSEYVRIGTRFQWILAKDSLEHAERCLAKAEFNLRLPEAWKKAGFECATRAMVAGLKRGPVEYRVSLQAVTRAEAISPSTLVTVDPRMLPKGRTAARLEAIKNRQKFNIDPMYVIHLDVDCVTYTPEVVKPQAYIREQREVVQKEFLSFIEGL